MKTRIIPLSSVLLMLAAASATAFEPISGYDYLSPETQAMQDDDFENPGMVAVERGAALFHEQRPDEETSCAGCHDENGEQLDAKSIAAYPVYDESLGGLVTLQDRVRHCWEINLDRFPRDYDDPEIIALETFVRHRAKGEVVKVQTDGPMSPLIEQGAALYRTRFGQLDISCYHCHVQHQGQMLRGQILNQGQANGFPEYRLGKGRITSMHQRLRECFIAFRAEPFDAGSREFKLLELYIMSRGNGLRVETPAVRF